MGTSAAVFITKATDLDVFKIAYQASLELHKLSLKFPGIEQYDLASQLRRASKSVCSNIVEGFSKQAHYPAEFKRFLSIALASCDEVQLWLKYSTDLGYINSPDCLKITEEYENIGKMLRSLRNKVKN